MADNDSTLRTRAEAKALGLTRYATGKPCKHGHIAERLTINGSCLECFRLKQHREYWANREENLRVQKVRRDSDPLLSEKKRARARARNPQLAERDEIRQRHSDARTAAEAAGERCFESPRVCPSGHLPALRYVKTGTCVACNILACSAKFHHAISLDPDWMARREAAAAAAEQRKIDREHYLTKTQPWRDARDARRAAFDRGDLTYNGKPCVRGHTLKYTSGSCVECAAANVRSAEKKAYDRVYLKKNRDRIKERTRKRLEDPAIREARAEMSRKWQKANPDKVKVIKAANKHKRRSVEKTGDSTAKLYAWEKKAPKVCYWCGCKCPKKYHVDHYHPLSKGGLHVVENLRISCQPCNSRKSAKDPYEFAATVGRLF